MASTSNKLFHTYENVGYDDQHQSVVENNNDYLIPSSTLSLATTTTTTTTTTAMATTTTTTTPATIMNNGINNNIVATASATISTNTTIDGNGANTMPASVTSIAVNKTAIESPFVDPLIHESTTSTITPNLTTKILSTTDSSGTTRMLTSSSTTLSSSSSPPSSSSSSCRGPIHGQNHLVTKLITFPPLSPMDSLKEWSVSTFKCTKQLINEKRGICPVTNDSQLQNDIEQLRENREKLVQMLRFGQQMTNHYAQLVRTQKQMHSLMTEMSIKCFNQSNNNNTNLQTSINSHHHSGSGSNNNSSNYITSKQVIANFSSLGNNLSSTTTTTSPTHHHRSSNSSNNNATSTNSNHQLEDFLPVLNYMRSSNLNLVDDFKKNAMTLNVAIKNGEKLLIALNFYCSNLATLIDKTIEDTLATVRQYETARLEYDAEKNSLNFISPTAQTSITYSSDKLELARMRYEQLKEDVQIKMKFLEENTIKVMHKQLLIFNGAFASYTSGNTAALDATLRQFSIKDTSSFSNS